MKILGALLITLACVGAGVQEVRQLTATERLWQDWVRLLHYMHTTLRYTARPMQELLAALDKTEYPTLTWLSEFDGTTKEMHVPRVLSEAENIFAKGFFGFVGTSDLEGQLTHITRYTEQAKERLKAASDRRQRLSKVYLSTAACVGLSIGIVML